MHSMVVLSESSVKRKAVKFSSLDSVLLENNTYYIPVDPSFPLFDAFTVEVDPPTKSADLWVLQMTTSPLHGGSERGYRAIRRIVADLKAMLKQEAPKKKSKKGTPGQSVSHVHYILVVPKGDRDKQWAFPIGWNENCTRNAHRGSVYCLQVAVSVEDIAARYSSSKPVPPGGDIGGVVVVGGGDVDEAMDVGGTVGVKRKR